ncbi:cell division protein ZapA [Candidiatus Paracoxiella cheracis]|uniref:cell division protein ZapA n=1 Tax=Candidiatus Paracoxiella cheracis TaxID=3405120 RepID=UPI003BF608F4
MSNAEDNVLSVTIMDRSYKIKCPPEQTQELQESAHYVNEQMKKIQESTNINSTERVAIVAALNICHELMQLQKQKNNYIDVMNQRIQDLQHRIENFLSTNEEIAV